jgi:hypothetical protein
MAIVKKPKQEMDFIAQGPDFAKPVEVVESSAIAISMKIDKELLAKIDSYAKSMGLTRSGLLKLSVSQYINKN